VSNQVWYIYTNDNRIHLHFELSFIRHAYIKQRGNGISQLNPKVGVKNRGRYSSRLKFVIDLKLYVAYFARTLEYQESNRQDSLKFWLCGF
jgi:hypothetical protein